jgi:hypothetical protein
LVYSSSIEDTWIGRGWELSLASIAVDPRTVPPTGGVVGHFEYISTLHDRLIYQGSEGGSAIYSPERAFDPIPRYRKTSSGWVVEMPDGQVLRFEAAEFSPWAEGSRWWISRAEDRFGNVWSVEYEGPLEVPGLANARSRLYPRRIVVGAAADWQVEVTLRLDTPPSAVNTLKGHGLHGYRRVEVTRMLRRIEGRGNGAR